MTTKKSNGSAAKKSGAAAQQTIPATEIGKTERAVRPYLLDEIQVDPRQPRAETSPEKTANVENIRSTLVVDESGVARPLIPIQIRKTPPWAENQAAPYMIFDGECRDLAAVVAGAKWILADLIDIPEEKVFEAQVMTAMAREGLGPSALLDAIKTFDERFPGQTSQSAGARLGIAANVITSLRKIVKLPATVRTAFIAGQLTVETCAEIAKIEGATDEDRADRQEKAAMAVAGMDARKAKEHIRLCYMLRLATAPFDREDETLNASAGKCSACPKRTAAQASLFGETDNAEDCCKDKACWDIKAQAAFDKSKEILAANKPAETEKEPPPKKCKADKPRKEDLSIAAILARKDVASADIDGHCGGMSAEAINEALGRLAAAGNELARHALHDRACANPAPYSKGSSLVLAGAVLDALREAREHMPVVDLAVLFRDIGKIGLQSFGATADPSLVSPAGAPDEIGEDPPAIGTFYPESRVELSDPRAEDDVPGEFEEESDMLYPETDGLDPSGDDDGPADNRIP